jgi:hypothetical protein
MVGAKAFAAPQFTAGTLGTPRLTCPGPSPLQDLGSFGIFFEGLLI